MGGITRSSFCGCAKARGTTDLYLVDLYLVDLYLVELDLINLD